jgi:hypothetical protein
MKDPIDASFDHCHNQNGMFNSSNNTPQTASSFGTSPQSPYVHQNNSEIGESCFTDPE